MNYAQIDPHGRCMGAYQMDPGSVVGHPIPESHRLLPVTADLHHVLARSGQHAFFTPEAGWRLLHEDAAHAWGCREGLSAEALLGERERRAALRDELPSAPLEESPQPGTPERRALLEPTTVHPGVAVRLMDQVDAAIVGGLVAESRLYHSPPELLRAQADRWWHDPGCWPIVVTWHGRPIEYEVYHWDQPSSDIVRAGFTFHVMTERPHWFWRECERPVFEALQLAGVTRIVADIRDDVPQWHDALKANYGMVETGRSRGFIHARYAIATALAKCMGWPARRTAGADWAWREGSLTLREAAEADLPAVRAAIAATWGARSHGRGAWVQGMLEQRWELDHASVLVGLRNETIVDVYIIRQRRPTFSLIATCMPWRLDDPDSGHLRYASTLWQQAVGYDETSSFTLDWMWNYPLWPRHFARLGMHVRSKVDAGGEPMTELRASIAELLARPREAWTA